MNVKRLIVNADDFGRSPGINKGVFEAHRDGIVTSASLMVNYTAAAEAAAFARQHADLGVGLHVALTGGFPALPPERIRTMVDSDGRLPAGPEGLVAAHSEEILAEARAQLKRFRDALGRDPTHFDTHHHSHKLPSVLEALVTLSWETGLPVRSVSPEMRDRLRREGIRTTDAFVESFYDEGATVEGLVRILSRLELGTSEIMCHPAVVDDELRRSSSYAEPRARELVALTHAHVRQAVQAAGIRLIHFGAL